MTAPTASELAPLARARAGFARHFGAEPTRAAAAPGRVNLIGDHTDYNDGLVLPMAIDRYTVVAADVDRSRPDHVRVASADFDGEARVAASAGPREGHPHWASYPLGVLAGFRALGHDPGGLRLWIESDVPMGAGLSSSAALEVATAVLAQDLFGTDLQPMELARLCQRAEHEFAGVPCGIMDQVASLCGRAGHAVRLDCRSLEVEPIAISDPGVALLVADSAVDRNLGSSEFAVRRAQCDRAAAELGVAALREIDERQLEGRTEGLDPILAKRARHVATENARVEEATRALRAAHWEAFGRTMLASHRSLRDDYEVSCAELDELVEIATGLGPECGVHGSRMTGGGFGGCTVTLVQRDRAAGISERIARTYRRRTGLEPRLLLASPAEGARLLAPTDRSRPRPR